MLTEKDLTEMCQKICAEVGHEFTLPIKINKRLTTTLGRVKYIKTGDYVRSTLMEFSYQFLSTSTFDSIQEVVQHECAHYLVTEETHQKHGHDATFKAMCARIHCTNDKAIYYSLERNVAETEIYKYFVKCKKCENIVGKYHRAGKIVKNPELYTCKCGGSIYIEQNY